MVLCTFFLNGHCRFGSKCVNDHIDLKTLLKTEVEAAINGKQWLLSCFGPFKESAVLPNFIPDRSFEEVRLSFLEASKNGTAQQHVNELIAQYNDSVTKLNQLKMATPDTIQLVANIYNQSVKPDQKKTTSSTANVFAVSNTTSSPQQQINPFQTSNIFGGSQQQATAMNAGSIFGSSTSNNPFQSSAQSNMFGSAKTQTSPAASNFSFALNQPAAIQPTPQQSIFGSVAQPNQQTSSIFAAPPTGLFSSVLSQPIQQQTNPFSQPTTGNIFGQFNQSQQQPQAVQQNVNLFATPPSANQTPNVFGMQQQPQQQQQQPSAPTGNIFQIQQPNQQQQQTFGGNPFQTQPLKIDDNIYSKPENLTPDELKAFEADSFQLGRIPLIPPPKHLCT
ncbi:CLUMA_CG021384, isoform A [Clunio marinus]|uniref:Nucleoporin NUP42 n=1 Tax=Clunio marinus TaxID=568069 RepID=A0A1J1J7Q7_9DIPT|nr:CLUMA_CG021384, isoform A [Clunio marinus]